MLVISERNSIACTGEERCECIPPVNRMVALANLAQKEGLLVLDESIRAGKLRPTNRVKDEPLKPGDRKSRRHPMG